MTVKPAVLDGMVVGFNVHEILTSGVSSADSLSLKIALSAIGVQHIADSMQNLLVKDAVGRIQLSSIDDPPAIHDDSAYRHFRAARPTSGPISIDYFIATRRRGEHGGPPLGMEQAGGGAAGNGIGLFLVPENSTSRATQLNWDLREMAAGSIGVITAGQGSVIVPGDPSEMLKQWILTGPAQVFPNSAIRGFHAYLLGDPPFDTQAMLAWSDRAYRAIGDWFEYLGLPDYNLLFRIVSGPSFATGTAGEGRGGSIINVGTAYWPGQDFAYVHDIVFHEMTHQWVGLITGRASWYEEGLTVYITATLPCMSGLVARPQCVESFNHAIRDYYTSPARHWSQAQIDAAPFAQEEVRRVPYGRGALYFAGLNAQLLRKSHGRVGLREALRPLLAARRDGQELDQVCWEAMLYRQLGWGAVVQFRRSMIDGTDEPLPPSSEFGPCFRRAPTKFGRAKDGATIRGYEWRPVSASRCNPAAAELE